MRLVRTKSGWLSPKKIYMDRIKEIALRQSAYDCSCQPEDFLKAENVIVESLPSDKARKYLTPPHICNLVSYGNNIVACAERGLIPELGEFLSTEKSIYAFFETPLLYKLNDLLKKRNARIFYMAEYFLPDENKILNANLNSEYKLRVLNPDEFANLYLPEWSNALCADRKHLDVIAVGAYDKNRLIGLAGCSADCEDMWQIGVDVLSDYRGFGVGSALTNRIARLTFEHGKVPFYCSAWSNVKSVKNAIKSGFKPAWVEVTAKPFDYLVKP